MLIHRLSVARVRLLAPLALVVALISFPSAALATSGSVGASASYGIGVDLPITPAQSMTVPPPRFTSNATQALEAAKRNRTMDAIHAREHPLIFAINVWNDQNWYVDFYYHRQLIAEVVETRAAHVSAVWTGPQASTLYTRGDFAVLFGHWWILIPFSLLFLLPFINLRSPRRLVHLDALVMLSLLVSYLLFDHAKLEPAVWMAYPPLLYLLVRMLWLGGLWPGRRGRVRRPSRTGLAPHLSLRVLAFGVVGLTIARIVIGFVSPVVIDVGYASVIGAQHIASGQPLYFMGISHSDTYGPIAYLAYLPFELLFPWKGTWNYLPSAHVASLVFDLVTIGGLVLLGRRMRPGEQGWRLGLAFAWAWSACPFTLLALIMHTNDGLIAMLSVLSLLAFNSPGLRGAVLGLAAAAKFAPAALLGIYAGQRDRGLKGVLLCAGAFAVVVVVSIGLYLPSGGLSEFYNHTIGYQLSRSDVFSPWALHPGLDPVKDVLAVFALALCALAAFVPSRRRTMAEVCALAAALTIAVQLPAVHWFYYYIVWFVPFVVVALLATPDSLASTEADVSTTHSAIAAPAANEPELVPAGV